MDRNVLMWYGHVERMEDERLVKRVYYMAKVKGSRGRPKLRWMDNVKAGVERKTKYRRSKNMCAGS
jgi:hypothetical protein